MKKRTADSQERFEAYGEYQYQPPEGIPAQGEASAPPRRAPKPKRRSRHGFFKFFAAVAALLVLLIVVRETAFRLETVYVVGNRNQSPQQVVMASGLVKGRNLLSIREEDVEAAIGRDHTLIYKGMQKDYPSTIYLYVEEREVAASLQWLGILYTLDAEGMVMAEHNAAKPPAGMPEITGLQVTTINVGQVLQTRSSKQMDAYRAIMKELQLQLYTSQVTSINLRDTANIHLETVEGVAVRLGDPTYMRAKIGAVRTDMAYLRQLGKSSGLLDVAIPEDAKYIPEK